MFFREIDAINSIIFYSFYNFYSLYSIYIIYGIYPFVLSAYHLGGIFAEAHFYFMGNESGDYEGDDCCDTEGWQDAEGDLQGVSSQPERHEVITYAKSDDGAKGSNDAVSKERAAQAITVVRTEDTADGYGTALALEVGTQEGD